MPETTRPYSGRKVVASAGTAEAISTPAVASWVTIVAESDNTGVIVLGGSDVVAALATRKGVDLSAGDSYSLADVDLSAVYIDATVSGDGVTFTYGKVA